MAKALKGLTTVTQIDKAIKQAIKDAKPTISHPIAGYKGLELRVRPHSDGLTATADFRHRYTHPVTGKRPYMTIGQYPAITLEQARQAHADNMRLLAQHIDPITHREKQRQAKANAMNNSFENVAKSWLAYMTSNKSNRLSDSTIREWNRFLSHPLKAWGKVPINEVTTPMVLSLCREIQKEHIQTGVRVRGICDRVFSYAIGAGMIEVNPALQVKGLLLTAQATHQPAITNPKDFGRLLRDIDALPDRDDRTALQLIAMLYTRVSDMCEARWADIDLEAAEWTLQPKKGKGRADMVESLIIPLPRQAVAILKRQYEKTGMYDYVFYNHRRRNRPYLDRYKINHTLTSAGKGYAGKHVPHGFRASAITMIQEQLKCPKYLPDMQSGHKLKDNNGEAYSRVKFLDERREMMQKWADYLDKLRAGENVIHASFKHPIQKHG